ncbi:uncharacterized protein LOC119375160 [Rhipicephalus sanguineus]|uniref:uncharacterized protein LOC119375160 n=1 Tax=Rhipicephalus sanguineus TaxID=34632 RepID=UPI0018957E2B|nr:uncharacterized protein LOC119375160 [Rhipicephalus sanguineus]
MGHYFESTKHEGLRYYFEEACRLDYDEAKEILSSERAARAVYRDAWKEADTLYKVKRKQYPSHRWNVMKKENFVAIMCYTLEKPNICRHFNQLCRAATPTKESWNSFPFKSLLYFLINAFNRLPDFHAPVVFRGVDKFVYSNDEARFSQFLSASVCPRQAAKFGRGVYRLDLRDIPASLMKDISIYSIYPMHREVLIWPFCVFTLTAGKEEDVKVLKFDHMKTWTSRSHLYSAPPCSRATAKTKSADRPSISGEQGAFSLGAPSAKRAKPTSRQTTQEHGRFEPPALSPVRRDTHGTSAGAVTSATLATWESQRDVIGKIKQDFVITVPRDSSNQPSLKIVPGGIPTRNASVDKMGARINVGQTHAHAHSKRLQPPQQVTRATVITIPHDSSREPSARAPDGRLTWNTYYVPVGVRNSLSQASAHVEPTRMEAVHQADTSCENRNGSRGLWKRVAAAVLIGVIVLLGILLLLKYAVGAILWSAPVRRRARRRRPVGAGMPVMRWSLERPRTFSPQENITLRREQHQARSVLPSRVRFRY